MNEWSEYKDSNLGPLRPKRSALPDCAILRNLASGEGFEPPDSRPGFGDQCTTPTVPTRLKLFIPPQKKPLTLLVLGACLI